MEPYSRAKAFRLLVYSLFNLQSQRRHEEGHEATRITSQTVLKLAKREDLVLVALAVLEGQTTDEECKAKHGYISPLSQTQLFREALDEGLQDFVDVRP